MTRLFILFYLGVLAVLAAAWYIHGAVASWQFGDEFRRVVEGTHRGGAQLVVDRLNAVNPEDRDSELERLRPQFDYPIGIRLLTDLPDHVADRIQSGAGLVYYRQSGSRGFVAAPLNDKKNAVRLGPFPNYSHYEDSLAGGMRLAVVEVQCAEGSERDEKLRQLKRTFGYDVQVIPSARLPRREQRRLTEGDDIVFFVRDEQAFVASPLEDASAVVQFGPFPNFEGAEQRVFAATLAFVLVVAAVAIALLLRPMARQLRYVENAAHAIADGDLSARVDEESVTSARPLAQAFNDMASRTEALVRTQRELLQAVSHELRTPLSRMRFAIDLIETAATEQERAERLASLDAATEELDSLVGELLSYVRLESAPEETDSEPVSLFETVHRLVDQHSAIFPTVEFELDHSNVAADILVKADSGALQRVLGNLLSNAGRYATKRVLVRAESSGDTVQIDVDDDGPGIPESDRDRVLAPFVRLDDDNPGGGVGLGLALVRRIVERHGGHLEILNSPSGGCRVRTTWGRADADSGSA